MVSRAGKGAVINTSLSRGWLRNSRCMTSLSIRTITDGLRALLRSSTAGSVAVNTPNQRTLLFPSRKVLPPCRQRMRLLASPYRAGCSRAHRGLIPARDLVLLFHERPAGRSECGTTHRVPGRSYRVRFGMMTSFSDIPLLPPGKTTGTLCLDARTRHSLFGVLSPVLSNIFAVRISRWNFKPPVWNATPLACLVYLYHLSLDFIALTALTASMLLP